MIKTGKILKFLSRALASLLFTFAFFMLFASVFGANLIENLPSLESSLKENFFESDILLEQLSKESGLTAAEIREACKQDQNKNQENCKQINNPEQAAASATDEIKKQIAQYEPILNNLAIPIIVVFILSLLFYFLGTMSIYTALFKISINAFFSAIFGFLAFSSFSKLLPGIVDQAFNIVSADISQEIPIEFKQNIINVINDWLKSPLSELNTLLIYIGAVSLITSIIFYLLKNRNKNNSF
ncbi:hypothetical protein HYT56_03590 [Candidatus Woesearchaeota archaeon]|nr:hypothetical protein [Candidatus Woesearchaeota archaeon]